MHRALLLTTGAAVLATGALLPAHAAPPASFSRTVTFVDGTPDPTAFFLGPEHCMGRLPGEKPVSVAIPGPGIVSVAIAGFSGEWSLMVTDKDGDVLATADADAPATESLTMRMKRAGRIDILPCNIAGTFEAKLTYGYTYKK